MLLASIAHAADYPSIDAPLRTGMTAATDGAVVIGIEDYADLPDVPYATADAEAVYNLLVYTRGVPASQARLLTGKVNNEMILAAVDEVAQRSSGRVFVYFAGHGAASTVTGERLLLGFDTLASASSFDSRAAPVSRILAADPKVVVIVDACYGAAGRTGAKKADGRWVVPVEGSSSQWVAAGPNEVAGPLDAAGHGAFTYLMVGALRGWADGEADGERDGKVTGEEAQLYVQRNLRELQLADQTPSLSDELGGVVFTKGVKEKGPTLATSSGLDRDLAELERRRREREAAEQAEREASERIAAKQAQEAQRQQARVASAEAEFRAAAAEDWRKARAVAEGGGEEGREAARLYIEHYGAGFTLDGVAHPVALRELEEARGYASADEVKRKSRAGWWVADGVVAAAGAGGLTWGLVAGTQLESDAKAGLYAGREAEAESYRQAVNVATVGGIAALGVAAAAGIGIAVVPTAGGGMVAWGVEF